MAQLMYQISTVERKKRVLRIPESHTLYLCPNACARRRGLRALRNGELDSVSFLSFSQVDIVTGAYEQCAIQACARLLASLPDRPRVVSLYVNCIDDFLGTDARALVEELSCQHPDVRFVLSRINPISEDVRASKLQSIHRRLYEPLEPVAEHDEGITLLGHFEAIPHESEFYRIVGCLGLGPVRQVFTCQDFDEYELLAKSRLAISLSHLGDAALADFGARLGVPGVRWHASYSIKEIERRYRELAAQCGGEVDCDSDSTCVPCSLCTRKRTTPLPAIASPSNIPRWRLFGAAPRKRYEASIWRREAVNGLRLGRTRRSFSRRRARWICTMTKGFSAFRA